MRELTFIGPLSGSNIGVGRLDTGETKKLLLIAEDGTEFQLKVDQRLVSVVTREFEGSNNTSANNPGSSSTNPDATSTTVGTSAPQSDSLRPATNGAQPISPREVQDRVRAGDTAEEVAAETGADLAYVTRFASQVLAECQQVISAAAACEVTHEGQLLSFEQAVSKRLRILGVDVDTVDWHALKAGHEWSVVLSYETAKEATEAWFDYSLARKLITPANEEALWLLAQPHSQAEEAQPESPITAPVTTRVPIQTPAPQSVASSVGSLPATAGPTAAGVAPQAAKASDQWDSEHPATKAQKRREAAQSSPAPQHQAPQTQRPESRVDLSVEPEPELVIDQRKSHDETAQTSPEWEDLLFGSPPSEGNEA